MFYAKIGALFICVNGYSTHPVAVAKFATAKEAEANAKNTRRLFPCIQGAVSVIQVQA